MRPRWKLLIYASVSLDIVEEAWEALRQLASALPAEGVTTLALVDMPTGSASRVSSRRIGALSIWEHVRTLRHVGEGRLEVLEDGMRGPTRMGDPATLERFVRWAMGTGDADRLALVILGHGRAWKGVGLDHEPQTQTGANLDLALTPADISSALQRALPARADGRRLDVLGLCACNMAAAEVLAELHPHAERIVASEDVIYADNWDFAGIVEKLGASPRLTAAGLCLHIAKGCACSRNVTVAENPRAFPARALVSVLSVFETGAVPDLLAAINGLAASFLPEFPEGVASSPAAKALQDARDELDEFNSTCWGAGRGACGLQARASAQVDIRQLLERLSIRQRAESLSTANRVAIDRLRTVLRRVISYSSPSPFLRDVGGLGIYFPGAKGGETQKDFNARCPAPLHPWRDFLRSSWDPRPLAAGLPRNLKLEDRPGHARSLTAFEPFSGTFFPARTEVPQPTASEERPLFGFTFGARTLGVVPGHPFYKKKLEEVYVPKDFRGRWHALAVGEAYRFIPIVGAGLQRRGRTRFWVEAEAWLQRAGEAKERPIVLGFNLQSRDRGDRDDGHLAYVGRILKERLGPGRVPVRLRPGDRIRFRNYGFDRENPAVEAFPPLDGALADPPPDGEGFRTAPLVISASHRLRVIRRPLPRPTAVLLGLERWRGLRVVVRSEIRA